ncbi:hypothetical protein Tco_0498081, partial [Tanacetum coccineum]
MQCVGRNICDALVAGHRSKEACRGEFGTESVFVTPPGVLASGIFEKFK